MSIRSFIAVDFEASQELRRLMSGLRSSGARLRVVAPENLHITLKFLGNMEEGLVEPIVDALEGSVGGISPFTVTIRGTGAFPRMRSPRVLWVGVYGGEPLVEIARRLEESLGDLGFPRERRTFSPHLTLARMKAPQGKEAAIKLMEEHEESEFGVQRVEALKLKKSELRPTGAVYGDVAAVALR